MGLENLDNILWRALSGSHAHLATGTDRIRRYAKGYSPLLGFRDPPNPDFAALAPFCEPGERFYCAASSTVSSRTGASSR